MHTILGIKIEVDSREILLSSVYPFQFCPHSNDHLDTFSGLDAILTTLRWEVGKKIVLASVWRILAVLKYSYNFLQSIMKIYTGILSV